MILSEISARYIATCHLYEGRPYADLAEELKGRIIGGERELPDDIFAKAFPHAYRIHQSGRDLQDYFESLNGSHNMLIWLFLANSARRRLSEEVLRSIVEHAEYCSVKVGQVGKGVLIPSLTNVYCLNREGLSWKFCPEEEGYYFLHGYYGGRIYVIREAAREDFERFEKWFEEKRRKLKLHLVAYT